MECHFQSRRDFCQGITKHLKTIEKTGLVKIDTIGRERFYHTNPNPLKEVNQWIKCYERFWDNTSKRFVFLLR